MTYHGLFTVSSELLADAWGIPEARIIEIYSDGRICHQQITDRIVNQIGGKRPEVSDQKGSDFSCDGGDWEARTMSHRGVHFSPSWMRGKDRKFNRAEFLDYVKRLAGFAVADIS